LRVKIEIALRIGCDGGDVMDAKEFHAVRISSADAKNLQAGPIDLNCPLQRRRRTMRKVRRSETAATILESTVR
jgi:hypothetical protein